MSAERRRPRVRGIVIVAVVLALVGIVRWLSVFYTDYLWYADIGQSGVFWTTLSWRWGTYAVFALVFFGAALVNLLIARREAPPVHLAAVGDETDPMFRLSEGLGRIRRTIEPFVRWVLVGASALLALAAGSEMAAGWQKFALAMHAAPFGVADPQFGRDVSFFVFQLPALRAISDWVFSGLITILVLTAIVHLIDGGIRPWDRLRGFEPHVKAHLSVLLGLIVASRAFEYWLRIWELDFSPRGQVVGAAYADVYAQLPALKILIVIALVSAVLLIVNIRFKGWRLPAYALGVWIAAAVLVGAVYPALVQQLRVSPNELAAEKPFIQRNIEMTRRAYGLDKVETLAYQANASLTASDVALGTGTLDDVRLWDPKVVLQTYKQLQEIRYYYDFKDVDIDRYVIDGQRSEVLIAAREMNVAQLQAQAKTWVNQHLVYTHGYGAVVSPVNRSTGQGSPDFLVKDLPPTGHKDLKITRPGIYFGEEEGNYVIVDTGIGEFDYPAGDHNVTTTYKGAGGVPVGGLARRIAFSLRYSTTQILFSSYVKPTSRVLYYRALTDRVTHLAPWLRLDSDPYITIVDGRLVWILDGYTESSQYPYAQRMSDGGNYIRNSVKVTIDAYDGTTTFYAWDPSDPVLKAWSGIFPGLMTDASKMPPALKAHVRYPENLFRIQADVYETYHMLDPQVFYNKEDVWALPGQQAGTPMAPYYILLRLPGETEYSFLLMSPFTPRIRDNMIGWMSAKCDPDQYGRRLVYTFPKQQLILGPQQISARINQDPTISSQLTLWNQSGSRVILGNMLVLPVKGGIIYVQPLYLQAEQAAIPELTRVIVSSGGDVVMEKDLGTALTALFGQGAAGTGATAGGGVSGGGASVGTTGTGSPTSGGASADAALANSLYAKALAAQRKGDWAAYGTYVDQLGTVLRRLAGQSKATTATPGK